MEKHYRTVYCGSAIICLRICDDLEEKGIKPIIKDTAESARLAGFGAVPNYQIIQVRKDQEAQALQIIKDLNL
ncbi:MAG: DUF2007 domain-containing protein [Flavobacteriaceae bacterium]|nr:DUF2007 domain-containing protein [Flavobacteriaceae bacterium]MCY4266642.1 DUF2007 domain-containing protein [Flavobacteriaceae bacterium]